MENEIFAFDIKAGTVKSQPLGGIVSADTQGIAFMTLAFATPSWEVNMLLPNSVREPVEVATSAAIF